METINPVTGYDANGNLLAFTGTESPGFSYDALDRLVTASAASFGSRDYDYDKNGNRTQLTADSSVTSYAYSPNSNRLSSLGGQTVTRDANGNTTGQGAWTYTYDKHNRLTKAYNSGTLKVTYSYNGLGQRVKKAVAGGGATRYVYGLNGQLLAETSNSGTVQRIYIYLNDTPLALLIGTTPYYIHTDHLGTPKALTSKNGTKVWSATHDPFGKATVNEDPDGNGKAVTFNLRFAGQYADAETGLHYNYFRYYDPETDRYLTADPIGLAGGINPYSYVVNNPLKYSDPSGLCTDPGGVGSRYCIQQYIPDRTAWWHGGDNRGPRSNGGTYRASQWLSFSPNGQFQSGAAPGRSTLGRFSRLGNQGPNSASASSCGKCTTYTANNSTSVGTDITGFIAPYATSDVTITECDGEVVSVAGSHTPYPNIEIWRYGGDSPQLIYGYDKGSNGPWDITGPLVPIVVPGLN